MSETQYFQYAFARPDCHVEDLGAGVDPRYNVELICEGPIAAVASRVGLDRFDPDRLQGKTPEDIRWLGDIAARHNEIVCLALDSSPVLPLRLGKVFRSRAALQAMLTRCQSVVASYLQQFGDRQEWGIQLYLDKLRSGTIPGHAGPPPPHYLPIHSETAPPTHRKATLRDHEESQAVIHQTVKAVEHRLMGTTENGYHIRKLPTALAGRSVDMLLNAALLLPSSAQETWLNTIHDLRQHVIGQGLVLEVSGPWPPYHFCPSLEL